MVTPSTRDHAPMPTVSVIVPSYNCRRTIDACLTRLQSVLQRPDDELVVVDSSTDGTDAYVRARFPQVRLIHLAQRTFAGNARNIGAREVSGALLAFVDSDCVVASNWLQKVRRSFEEHPEQDACVGRIENHNPYGVVSWVSFITEFNGYFGALRRRRTFHLPSYSVIFRRHVFESAGGFPEDVEWLEDMLLTAKLVERGARLFVDPAIVVAHHNRDRLRDFLNHQYKLGRYFAHSRFAADLPGASALRATALSIPFLAFWRATLALARTFHGGIHLGCLLLALSPVYGLGMAAWTAGVSAGRRDCRPHGGRTC